MARDKATIKAENEAWYMAKLARDSHARAARKEAQQAQAVAAHAKYVASHKGRVVVNRDQAAESKRQREYNITSEQREAMHVAQGGRCAICGVFPAQGRKLVVDHDHATGEVRALLCMRCNTAVGYHEIDIAEAVRDYVLAHSATKKKK